MGWLVGIDDGEGWLGVDVLAASLRSWLVRIGGIDGIWLAGIDADDGWLGVAVKTVDG